MTWFPPQGSGRLGRLRRGCNNRAFTFIEIMMVVLIIGMLAAIVMPYTMGKADKARIKSTKVGLQAIETALAGYEMNVGEVPSTEQGVKALVERPSDVPEDKWERQLKSFPLDAWGRPFVYRCPGENGADYDLFSMGKDGKEGTPDDIYQAERDAAASTR